MKKTIPLEDGMPPREPPAFSSSGKGVAVEFLFFGFLAGLYVLWEVVFRYFGWLVEAN
jgi:hypothetical protein